MLDNISQENNQEDVKPQISADSEGFDIQFEEIIDIDKIQRELRQEFGDEDAVGGLDSEFNINGNKKEVAASLGYDEDESTAISVPSFEKIEIEPVRIEVAPKDKKYVVYINSDNIDFMENLSPSERKETINKILKEQNAFITKKKIVDARNKFIKHIILATFTFVIGFPLLFLCVNKAMELTMQNYNQAKTNFSKLYKKQGKIKSSDPSAAQNFKY